MGQHSSSAVESVREEQRLLLREFIAYMDEGDSARGDEVIVQGFLDSHGIEFRTRVARIQQELGPAQEMLNRGAREDGLHRSGCANAAARVNTALELLKGE